MAAVRAGRLRGAARCMLLLAALTAVGAVENKGGRASLRVAPFGSVQDLEGTRMDNEGESSYAQGLAGHC